MRNFLFLQGPLSFFFYRLGQALQAQGVGVYRINFCGGDCVFWPGKASFWQGPSWQWPQYIGQFLKDKNITDVVLLGDWRPLHHEAVLLAQARGSKVWVYEEGYLRPGFLTLEEGGVNATSRLPKNPIDVAARACELQDGDRKGSKAPNPMYFRVLCTAWHHVGNFCLWPLFFRYKTHRPYCIGRELLGHLPRFISHIARRKESINVLRWVLKQNAPFYFFPLQLDSDSQIRRYSPFTGVLDALATAIISFAAFAPPNSYLLIKNHPLDNGLINYRRYIRALGQATGCVERLRFVEGVNNTSIIDLCQAVVLCNSTLGLTALQRGRAVYCMGEAIYAMPGLAVSEKEMPLKDFWREPRSPNQELVQQFCKVLRHDALVPGNFYNRLGISDAIVASMERMGIKSGSSPK
ncbi:MAG: capsular biosynthesis protein [Desulfovibrionaceae bacterium]|nr:capsular biosynthesis protein [Desulfovibrionaceae bacterium]